MRGGEWECRQGEEVYEGAGINGEGGEGAWKMEEAQKGVTKKFEIESAEDRVAGLLEWQSLQFAD